MKKYIFLILVLIFISTALFSQSIIDSLETELITVQGDDRALILVKLVHEYRNIDPQKSIEYGNEVLAKIDDLDNEIKKAVFFNDFGWAYYNQKDYQAAIEHTERCLEIGNELNNLQLQAFALNGLGAIYWGQNYYEIALEKYLLALRLQEKINDRSAIAVTLGNIGLLFSSLMNSDKSLEYYFKALEIHEELGNKRDIAIAKLNIASVYAHKDNPGKALEYSLSSLQYGEEIGDERLIGIILTNTAITYYIEFHDLEKALEYFNRALIITKKYDDKGNIIRINLYLGSIYKDMGEYNIALEKENEALQIAEEINDLLQIEYIYEEISSIYADMKDFENAFNYYVKYKSINDSSFSLERSKIINEMQTKYETEKKEQQITLLEKDNTIAKMEITKQRSLLLYLTTGIILIVIFAIIVIRLFNQKAKTAAALAVANGKLEELSRTDPLTKLWNRRYIHEMIERERIRVERDFKPFSFILMDIDHFKNVNDTYGHECGDYVISTIAVILRSAVRKQDMVCRWGGEEFLLFLPETLLDGAVTIAESIRKKIENYPFAYESKNLSITVTLGVSEFDQTMSVENSIKLADDALYEGKESGRNRVASVQGEDKKV